MKKNLKLITIMLLMSCSAYAQPCTTPIGGTIVGPSTVCVGSFFTYTDPTSSTGGGTATWSSSNTTVASIGLTTGLLHAIGTGTTTISYSITTTTCGTATATFLVTVVNTAAPITGTNPICLGQGDTLFDAVGGGSWSSGTMGVATIDPVTGIVTTAGTGTTLISYTNGTCSTISILTVNPVPAAIVGPSAVCRFSTITLTDPTGTGTWSSTVPLAASVGSTSGVVSGVGPGGSATNILYTLPNGCSVSQYVAVTAPPVPITGPNHVCQGSSVTLTELVPGGTWTTSVPGVVSSIPSYPTNIVSGVGTGPVLIIYTTPSCPPDTFAFTVNPLPTAITGPTAVCVGRPTTLVDTTAGGTWSSSDTTIHITSGGVATATVSGVSSVITYSLPTTCFVTTTVNVGIAPPLIMGASSVCQGASTTLTDADTTAGVWSSTDLAIAQVIDSSGVVNGISAGTVNISYTLPTGCFAVLPFMVQPPVIPSVHITSMPAGIVCEGTPDTFIAVPTNGGSATYSWSKFSVPFLPSVTSDTFIYSPLHGDVINCMMIAHGVCTAHDTVGDTFAVNVYPNNVSPSITITTTGPDTAYYVGQVVTFYSSVLFGGTAPAYQWYRNGAPVSGANGPTYTTPVYQSDTFWCAVSGNPPCEAMPPAPGFSNIIVIHDYLGVKTVAGNNSSFSLFPNPNNGNFTLTGTVAPTANTDISFEISNMLGQVVYSGKTTPLNGKVNAQAGLGNLPAGSYLLRVNTGATSEALHFVVGK